MQTLDFCCVGVAVLFGVWLVLVFLACWFCRTGHDDVSAVADLSTIRPGTPVGRQMYHDRQEVSGEELAQAGYPEDRASYED